MPQSSITIYQKARISAGLTQEQAAEALSVSLRTVTAWEQREREPTNTTVWQMCEAYGTPWLALEHLKISAEPLGILPDNICVQGLPTAVLALINRATALADDYRRLMTIAEDGVIDDGERTDFSSITDHIQDVIAAGFQVIYARDTGIKKDHPTAGTVRRSVLRQAKNDCRNIIPDSTENASMIFAGKEVSRI